MRWDILWDAGWVSLGAIIGALLRYGVTGENLSLGELPVSVLLINILGSFILGVTATATVRLGADPRLTLFVGIGFCGSLTTMSSFAFETASLLDLGKTAVAFADILLNVGASIAAIFLGRAVVMVLMGAV
ncbi:MAG: fluoride efflux transporter CrcB [Thaumarchaeota archaeon]|nr:fluoride efflux transporter CrcB [Nitrososphaerota archaeon]